MSFFCEAVGKAAPEDRRTEIERLAESLEPSIAKAVRRALQDHLDAVDLDELEDAIRAGDNGRVLAMVGDLAPAQAGAIKEALEDAVWAGGAFGQREPVLAGAQFTFNRLNPALIDWLQSYSFNLIRDINQGTREAVRGALTRGIAEGRSPIDQARDVRASVGLTKRQALAVASYRKALETFHLKRSAKGWGLGAEIDRRNGRQVFRPGEDGTPLDGIDARRLRDFRYDGVLQRAIETKTALKPEQIERMVQAYQRKYLRHRSKTIARTESLRAAAAGHFEAWRQAIADGKVDGDLVRKLWIVAPEDGRTCKVCAAIPTMNPKRGVRINAAFKTTLGPMQLPPAHPNCRCTVFFRLFEASQLVEQAA